MSEQKSAILDRYSAEQVAFWIDGYYIHPGGASGLPKSREEAFAMAKDMLIHHMHNHIANIEAMSFDQWIKRKEAGI